MNFFNEINKSSLTISHWENKKAIFYRQLSTFSHKFQIIRNIGILFNNIFIVLFYFFGEKNRLIRRARQLPAE